MTKKNTTKKSAVKKTATKKTTTKKTSTKKVATKKTASKKAVKLVSDCEMYSKLRNLRPGHSVTSAKFGTVKCTAAGKQTKSGRKSFSVSQSKVVQNRGGYTFGDIVKAFGLKK